MARTATMQTEGRRKARKILEVPQEEVCSKYSYWNRGYYSSMNDPDKIAAHVQDIAKLRQDATILYHLWQSNESMGREVVCIGQPFPSFISPSEIFINAHIYMVRRLVLVRLDFSGRAFPTPEEIEITRFIVERCRQIEIDLADHVVISDNGIFSFYKEGLLYLDKKDRPQPVNISLATNRMQ